MPLRRANVTRCKLILLSSFVLHGPAVCRVHTLAEFLNCPYYLQMPTFDRKLMIHSASSPCTPELTHAMHPWLQHHDPRQDCRIKIESSPASHPGSASHQARLLVQCDVFKPGAEGSSKLAKNHARDLNTPMGRRPGEFTSGVRGTGDAGQRHRPSRK